MKEKKYERKKEFENTTLKRPKSNSEIEGSKKLKAHCTKKYAEMDKKREGPFNIEIEKLLKDTEVKNKYKKKLTSWIEDFQIFLNTLPIHNATYISNFSREVSNRPSRDLRFIKNIASHSKNNLRCDKDISITFIRPECVGTFGLYKIDSLPGPNIEINLHMTIPRRCFKAKDFLNNRYFVKKFFYLMYLAEHLHSQNICSSIKCGYYYENVLLPYLILRPKSTEKIRVRIFLIPEQNYFKASIFSPEVNNIEAQVFEHDVGNINDVEDWPTTLYNAALAFDMTLAENNVFIEQIFSSSNNIQKGLKLIIIWMNKRNLDTGLGGFSTDLATYVLVYLISRGIADKNMTPVQILRNFLYFLCTSDLTKVPISICGKISEEELLVFKESFDVVVMDKTGYYNVASFLNINAYMNVKNECKLALDILDRCDSCFLPDLFSINIPFYLQYDAIIDVKNDNHLEILLRNVNSREKTKYIGYHILLYMKILQEYLNRGFHGKIFNIVPIIPDRTEWNYGERFKMNNCRILFGIQFNPYMDAVDLKADTSKCRRNIIKIIANEVMSGKLNLNYKLYYNELEEFLSNGELEIWYNSGTNEETTRRIIKSSEDLKKKILSLKIQTGIVGIREISDVFSFTNVFPPIPCSYTSDDNITTIKDNNLILKSKRLTTSPEYVEPVECVIQLDHDAKTLESLKILQQRKNVFLLQISNLLKKQYYIISSVKPPYMDILYEGIVFRYILCFSNEISQLKKREQSSDQKIGEIRLQMEKKCIVGPKIVEALKGINLEYPSYGVSTCLAKRWIRAQLVDDNLLPDMAINLLNAHQYLHHKLYNPAVAPQVAFLRFLKLLVELQWDSQPIVINFNDELSHEIISKVKTEMKTDREKFSTLFILTPYDYGKSIFTKEAPCKEVLTRLRVLAREFLEYAKDIILEESLYSWKELFIPNRRGFHCILNLNSSLNPRRHHQITRSRNESKVIYSEPNKNNQFLPIINFDPVQMYLKDLRMTYGDYCVFFHDTYGGNYIGVLWKPDSLETKGDTQKGFEILGRDILKSIENEC